MRGICMLVPDFDRTGGYERQAFALSRNLHLRGLRVFILTNKTRAGLADFEERDGIPIYRDLPTPVKRSFSYRFILIWSLAAFFSRYRREFDIVHAHALTHVTIAGMWIGRRFGKKTLVKIATGGDLGTLVHSSRLSHRMMVRLLRRSDACISLSDDIMRELQSVGVRGDRIFPVQNGVDTERFSPADAAGRERMKEILHLPRKRIVTFVGRFEFRKGADLLLRAWKQVRARCEDVHLVLIGFGEEDGALKELADGLELAVSFLGERPNVAEYLRASDLFVIPSRREGNPNTLLEALASGLPVVATAIGGIVEVVESGVNGLLVAPDNEAKLAGKIVELLRDEELAAHLGRRARETACSRFSFDTIGGLYIEKYRALLSGRNR